MTDKQEPTDWRAECENLLDVWRDSERPYDHRHYVSGTFRGVIKEIEAKLAAPPAQPAPAQRLSDARIESIHHEHTFESFHGGNTFAWKTFARAIEAAIVPSGYVVVPVEPTPEMIDAIPFPTSVTPNIGIAVYRAMIAAAKDKP